MQGELTRGLAEDVSLMFVFFEPGLAFFGGRGLVPVAGRQITA